MNNAKISDDTKTESPNNRKAKIRRFIRKAKRLQGNPRYLAKGAAIGVFVGVTPTIPFHTIIAIALAFIFKGSKPAAAIGTLSGNPVTIPFFYMGSYKVGKLILGSKAALTCDYWTVQELLKLGFDTTMAMILGGVILGILPAIAAYLIALSVFSTIHDRRIIHKSVGS